MPARPRILLLIKCLGYGGAERLIVDVVANRTRGEFDYEVAYVLRDEDALVPAVEATGVVVHCLGARGNGDLAWMPRLRRLLDAGRFDIVHFHLPYSAGLGRLVVLSVPRRRRPVTISTEHSIWAKTPWPARLVNAATIHADRALLAVSDAARDGLPPRLRRRGKVVVHGIDLTASARVTADRDAVRRQVRDELGIPDDEALVMTVANLRPEKGYGVLLAAVRRLADRGAKIHVAAVGRGPMADELHRRRVELGIEGAITFLGQRADVLRLLGGADLFVLASHHEGLPVALMEATSVGLPVVASAVGEIPAVIRPGVEGLLVEPGDPDALADAIAEAVADPERLRYFGAASLERAALFDITRAVARIEDVYRGVLGRPVGPGAAADAGT